MRKRLFQPSCVGESPILEKHHPGLLTGFWALLVDAMRMSAFASLRKKLYNTIYFIGKRHQLRQKTECTYVPI